MASGHFKLKYCGSYLIDVYNVCTQCGGEGIAGYLVGAKCDIEDRTVSTREGLLVSIFIF